MSNPIHIISSIVIRYHFTSLNTQDDRRIIYFPPPNHPDKPPFASAAFSSTFRSILSTPAFTFSLASSSRPPAFWVISGMRSSGLAFVRALLTYASCQHTVLRGPGIPGSIM